MSRYTQARRDADRAYQAKIHKLTVVFTPEDEELWNVLHRLSPDYGGASPMMKQILKEFVHGLPTDSEKSSNFHKCPDA